MGSGIIPAIMSIGSSIGDAASGAAGAIGDAASAGLGALGGAADWAGGALGSAGDWLGNALGMSGGPSQSAMMDALMPGAGGAGAAAAPASNAADSWLGGIVPGYSTPSGSTAGTLASIGSQSNKGLSNTSLALGALAALGQMFAGHSGYNTMPGPSTTAATRGPLFNQPLATSYVNRQFMPQTPAGGSYYTYGQYAQPQFYQGNQLNFPPGMAHGGAMSLAHEANGGHEGHVDGPGDGMDDAVPARLSNGEYVLTAADVSRIGRGSNKAGALKIDHMREQLAHDTGGDKIMKTPKSPLQYLRGAA